MRKAITICLALFLFILPFNTVTSEWEEGTSWSYRWIYDFSENRREIESMIAHDDLDVYLSLTDGGYVCLFDIRYVGVHDGLHRFDYVGGYYAEGRIHYTLDLSEDDVSGTGNIRIDIDRVESDFEGSVWVKEYEYDVNRPGMGDVSVTAYGIVEQTIFTTGTADIETKAEMEVFDGQQRKEGSMDYLSDNEWEMDLEMRYDPPLPWIPLTGDSSFRDQIDITVDYTGTLDGYALTYNKIVETTIFDIEEIDIDERVDTSIDRTEVFSTTLDRVRGDEYEKASPILGTVTIGNTALLVFSEDGGGVSEFMKNTLGTQTSADFDDDTGFYSSFHKYWMGFEHLSELELMRFGFNVITVESESTSRDEVDEFLEDKEAYYDEHIERTGPPDWIYLAMVPAMIIIMIVILGFVLLSRKKSEPTTYYPEE